MKLRIKNSKKLFLININNQRITQHKSVLEIWRIIKAKAKGGNIEYSSLKKH